MSNGETMDAVNRRTMSTAVRHYRWSDALQPSEQAALDTVRDVVQGKRILDLGVGAGRTVKGLREVSQDYLGVDYMQEMVDDCRRRFPNVRFERVDARSMPQFADASFDLVVFSCNGICMVDHAGRLSIPREVYRLRAPGGYFLFSTSNRDDPDHGRFLFPRISMTGNPMKLLLRAGRFLVEVSSSGINRLRYKRSELRTSEYAILNDRSHRYATMNYFITMGQQLTQLREIGFSSGATVFDLSGRVVERGTTDGTMTFITRKPVDAVA